MDLVTHDAKSFFTPYFYNSPIRIIPVIAFIVAVCIAACKPAKVAAIPQGMLVVDSLPTALYLVDSAVAVKILSADAVQLTAGKGTDLHNPASGAFRKSNAPKLLFSPHQNFDLWVKVAPQFKNRYDGGAIILYSDRANWAKLLFQYTGSGYVTGMSVVKNYQTDDSYYPAPDTAALYLRLKKVKDVCSFYTSVNGQQWNLTRQFTYTLKEKTSAGFYAQSPVGNECAVLFSEIRYKPL